MSETETHRMIEAAARDSYGRLVAYLAARSGDVAGAEDALGDAFVAAMKQWPVEGLPAKPEAWLLTAARRQIMDKNRHAVVHDNATAMLQIATEAGTAQHGTNHDQEFPDERLKLLFVCAHPGIDPASRTPLMLQTVLNLEAADIASAFLTSPAAMSQRLLRAKIKIRDAGIPFIIPAYHELPERVEFVLDAVYAAYNNGWINPEDDSHDGMATEAIWLARVLTKLMPEEPEALGLLALMLYCQGRRHARLDAQGCYVPLPEQDVTRWDRDMMREAEELLQHASSLRKIGRFQLEAAIQSVHCQRAITGVSEWAAIVALYTGLLHICPSIGARIGYAIALSKTNGAAAGLHALAQIPELEVANYQPYWAAYAHLLAETGQTSAAQDAYTRAIGLSIDPASRKFLTEVSERVKSGMIANAVGLSGSRE